MGRLAIRHHNVLTETLRLNLLHPPSDSLFRNYFLQFDEADIFIEIRDWAIAQIPGGAADVDQMICDGTSLRGLIEPTAGGGSTFIAQFTLYSGALDVVIINACYANGENHARPVRRQLFGELDLGGVLIQVDALHTQRPLFGSSRSRVPTSA